MSQAEAILSTLTPLRVTHVRFESSGKGCLREESEVSPAVMLRSAAWSNRSTSLRPFAWKKSTCAISSKRLRERASRAARSSSWTSSPPRPPALRPHWRIDSASAP